jgi:hypothetical protein
MRRGIKFVISRSARNMNKIRFLAGMLRGGVLNPSCGYRGVAGKTDVRMLKEVKRTGAIKLWLPDKATRDEAYRFCQSVFNPSDGNKIVKDIRRVRCR